MNYDYIVAGGGSDGCVVATRLVRERGARVLLVERGRRRSPWLLGVPAGYTKFLAGDPVLEMHHTVAQPALDGRGPIVPQARLLGGGSAVNAMVYMRGQHEDYDGWDRFLGGASGWSYADMLPHFRAMEHNARLKDEYHGSEGPLWVSDPGHTCAMTHAFIAAARASGVPANPDFNGARQNGVGLMQNTIGGGKRCSAVRAFLSQVFDDPRLHLVTEAQVTRILFERGRAAGIEYADRSGVHQARAGSEVLLSCGTYNTAKLMMISGVGPAAELQRHGIGVVHDAPGVGQNLQDHHEVPLIATTRGAYGYYGEDRGWRMLRNGLRYLLFGSGPAATMGVEACLFHDPDGGPRPTIQLYCVPSIYVDRDLGGITPTHGLTLTSCLLRPRARGWVRLRSADPAEPPLVNANFFGDPDDARLEIAALRHARRLLQQAPLAGMVEAELLPGAQHESDEALRTHCNRTVKTNYHPVGTARMGPDGDPMAVLDTKLRVRGVEGLRVIDCSAIPLIPSGNTNAPALALAHRAVEFIPA
ncbi:MAG: GMC family oxidoreductase N-terminal domain-containing protein [Burkholderiales bacterium]|nr:GMC family oxidoreductase N-terminal domain-containing protein [Burkholderiales bacterium]